MKSRILVTIAGLMCIYFSGCEKAEEGTYHGVVRNSIPQNVRLSFYENEADYLKGTNPMYSTTITPNGEWEIPSEMEGGKKVYVDWYSEDYRYTNWAGGSISRFGSNNNVTFNVPNISPEMNPAMTLAGSPTYSRIVCLDKDKDSTSWHAVDAGWGGTSSTWDQLTPEEKYKRFTLRKNLTGRYSYKKSSGEIVHLEFTYQFQNISQDMVRFTMVYNSGGGSATGMSSPQDGGIGFVLHQLRSDSNLPGNFNSYNFIFEKD